MKRIAIIAALACAALQLYSQAVLTGPDAPRIVGLRAYAFAGGGTEKMEISNLGDRSFSVYGGGAYVLAGIWRNLAVVADAGYLGGASSDPAVGYADAGLAYVLPVDSFMPFAAFKLGFGRLDWTDSDLGVSAERGALRVSMDLGCDYRFGDFLLGARYEFSKSTWKGDPKDIDGVGTTFSLLAGWRFR